MRVRRVMERKDETKAFIEKDDDGFKEKIVYKIIPVPYYYPVPVDPDWYNKSYERQFRPNEFSSFPFVDTTVDHGIPPPPPGFPFPRFRHPHPHHVIYEPSTKRVLSPTSPPLSTIHSQSSSPPKSVENGRGNDDATTSPPQHVINKRNHSPLDSIVPVSSAILDKHHNDVSDEERLIKETKKANIEEIIVKTELDDNDEETVTIVNGVESPKDHHEENEGVEAIRDRKRYLMTFPYDQKKRIKVNGHSEGHDSPKLVCSKDEFKEKPVEPVVQVLEKEHVPVVRTEIHEPHFAAFPPGAGIRYQVPPGHHQPVGVPQGVPYVMVPVQSPAAFLHPKIIHQPHFPAELRRSCLDEGKSENLDPKLEYRERHHDGMEKDESPGEVKYHPNGRRARTVFTRQQLSTLNNVFEKHHFVSGERMSELSDQLGLDRKIVKIWFQNKRQYSRKKGSLLERDEEDYYEYQDSFNAGNAPPTMTMVNVNRTIDDISYKLSNDENVTYKINEDYMEKGMDENTDYNKIKEEKLAETV